MISYLCNCCPIFGKNNESRPQVRKDTHTDTVRIRLAPRKNQAAEAALVALFCWCHFRYLATACHRWARQRMEATALCQGKLSIGGSWEQSSLVVQTRSAPPSGWPADLAMPAS